MKKLMSLIIVVTLLMISGCGIKEEAKTDSWGITLKIKDVTPAGATLIFIQDGTKVDGDLQTGTPFYIEENKDGEWIALSTNPLIDYAWTMEAYLINKNGETEFDTEWKWLYGELPSGTYRITKEVMNFRKAGDFDKANYSATFVIE